MTWRFALFKHILLGLLCCRFGTGIVVLSVVLTPFRAYLLWLSLNFLIAVFFYLCASCLRVVSRLLAGWILNFNSYG